MDKTKLVIILGPTATGKSSLAVRLCRDFDGCVVNADSVQLYKHLDIGTAKPINDEMGGVPHYLIDILDPRESFSAAQFRAAAIDKIKKITAEGKNVFGRYNRRTRIR
jgi:tRNA dimethylallyltransferase